MEDIGNLKTIRCTLDADGCIDLLSILRVINQINQEQAWATCYELASLMQRLSPANCAPIERIAQIYLHNEGSIHEKSLLLAAGQGTTSLETSTNDHSNAPPVTSADEQGNSEPRRRVKSHEHHHHHHHHHHHKRHHHQKKQPQPVKSINNNHSPEAPAPPTPPITPELNEPTSARRLAASEQELVASLGIALFGILDYGIPNDQERKLCSTMEYLIVQSQNKLSLDEVLKVCVERLPNSNRSQADSHYRTVCKRLVSDTIELSIFLEKIYTASMVLSDITLDPNCLEESHECDMMDEADLSDLGEPLASLRALRINDWARLWMQVIRELRQQGKFKQALAVN